MAAFLVRWQELLPALEAALDNEIQTRIVRGLEHLVSVLRASREG